MKKLLIILTHFILPSFGFLEYCFSKSIRKLKYNLGYHYAARIHHDHPAYQDIFISLKERPKEPIYQSHMLCKSGITNMPQYITWTIPLN